MTFKLDTQAMAYFSRAARGDWGGVPWDRSVDLTDRMTFKGLAPSGLQGFPKDLHASGLYSPLDWQALLIQSDADVDTDGTTADTREDPCAQSQTSLRWPGGRSCDSRTFHGIALPPQLREFGVRLGDCGIVTANGKVGYLQFYDICPRAKIGEFSLDILLDLGEHVNANCGDDRQHHVALMFPGSGNGFARPLADVETICRQRWDVFTGMIRIYPPKTA